jgi:hypothetical protein
MAKRNTRQTSKSVASKASKIRYSRKSKSVAGSALSQTRSSKKK